MAFILASNLRLNTSWYYILKHINYIIKYINYEYNNKNAIIRANNPVASAKAKPKIA